jgi:hypothetical protein
MLKSMSRIEQRRVVTAALRAYDKWADRRFWLVVVALLLAAYAISWLAPTSYLAGLRWWAIPIGCALAFSGFLLWDINGPTLRAVRRYFSEQSIA